MDIFALSWIFFSLFQDLSREKQPISCTKETWKVCTFAVDFLSPAKELQFMSIHGGPEPKSEQ